MNCGKLLVDTSAEERAVVEAALSFSTQPYDNGRHEQALHDAVRALRAKRGG